MKKAFALVTLAILLSVPLQTARAIDLPQRLAGRILLQAESHGEAWYVDPVSLDRRYLRNGDTAYTLMREMGLGITNTDLLKIPIANEPTTKNIDQKLVERLKGKILLQVESHGEAWYIHPVDGKRYYLANGDSAYQIMRNLSLGISNSDLLKIPLHRFNPVDATRKMNQVLTDSGNGQLQSETAIDAGNGFYKLLVPVATGVLYEHYMSYDGDYIFFEGHKNSSAPEKNSENFQKQTIEFIKNEILKNQYTFQLKSFNKLTEYLYELDCLVDGLASSFYTSAKGDLVFVGKIMIGGKLMLEKNDATVNDANAENSQPVATALPKSEKPTVELFVMSYCPYGLQMEKGILPVLATLGDSIDFQLKFVDYAMHGEKELSENMTEHCVQNILGRNGIEKYLACFTTNDDSEKCLDEIKIARGALSDCVSSLDKKYDIMTNAGSSNYPPYPVNADDNEKYDVQGSPTLIINSVEADSARDSQSLLETICETFTLKPESCATPLSSQSPAPGFGIDFSNSQETATCN